MTPRWKLSSEKHGVPRHDQIYAILHATFRQVLDEPSSSGRIVLYIGPEHAETERELEILVREFPDSSREASIFHAMPLGPKFRRYREEHSDD